MTAQIIDGKKIALEMREKIKSDVKKLREEKGIIPALAVILVGNDPASEIYVGNKEKAAHEVGMNSILYKLSDKITENELISKIEELNRDPKVHGILVQLPLPLHINAYKILHLIDPKKDVDGFNIINVGKLSIGQLSGKDKPLIPCTPQGCIHLIKSVLGKDLTGFDAIVIGTSNIVGRPLARLLMHEKCTVTIAHSKTKNLREKTLKSDIVISATGVPGLIKGDMVNNHAVIIDVGMNRITDEQGKSKLVGDVEFANVSKTAGFITPVPGGVGPMTIAYLLQNTVDACKLNN